MINNLTMTTPFVTSDTLIGEDRCDHAFFTREDGVSSGLYASLNCGIGSGDDIDNVHENRSRAMARLNNDETNLATLYQVHSADVVVAEEPWTTDERPKADALVTRQTGLVLGILTADCAPVLLADETAGVIGAAHAGWKGALSGVVEATVDAMVGLGARRDGIAAAVGPCIHQKSYEVGPEFRDTFIDDAPGNHVFFEPSRRDRHYMFDLPGYLGARLFRLDLKAWDITTGDTCADEKKFFSYRRATLRGESDYGRGLSAIVLKE